MRVSLEWLKEYVDIDSSEELTAKLTMSGIAVEAVEEVDGDQVLILELTPNRGDCYGMINLAREVAAITGKKVKIPTVTLVEAGGDVNEYVKVDIQAPDLCPRYAARVVKNINIEPSPAWMQSRLVRAGIRPINNIVDITNYVMLETNQPLHAFDYRLIKGGRIIVRRAGEGERFITLDDVERNLDSEMLVIADEERAIALAGVMGGQNTEINEGTRTVLLESANFCSISVRRTSRRLGLRTESSIRFEKGADPNGVVYAINRAAQLVEMLKAGEVVTGVSDLYPGRTDARVIELRPERVNHLLGTDLSPNEIRGYLENLGFPLKVKGGRIQVTIPSYRPDLELEVDLIEEVARLYGYNNIPSTLPHGPVTQGLRTPWQQFRDRSVEIFSRSLTEVINYSFINPRWLDLLLLGDRDRLRQAVKVANPLSEEQNVMRTTLLPGMLDTLSRNLARKNENLALFEMGAVFYPQESGLPVEKLHACGITSGKTEINWQVPSLEMDFFYLKGIVEDFLSAMRVTGCEYKPAEDHPSFHPGRTAIICQNGKELGILGEIHPRVLDNFGVKKRACAFELDLEAVFAASKRRRMAEEITRYPAVVRDLAILVPAGISAATVTGVIRAAGGGLLRKIILFDVYQGDQIPEDYKSLAYSLTFQSDQETLQDDQVNSLVQGILEELQKSAGAKLR